MRGRVMSLLLVGSMVLGSCEGSDSTGSSHPDVGDQGTTTLASVESTEAAGTDELGPGIPPLDCVNLLTFEEVFDALGGNDVNADFDWGFISYSKSEVCRDTLASDEAYFVEIGPGSPDDFNAGAELNGSVGEPVDDVGEGALWFGGVAEQGAISVRKGTEYGTLHFRVAVGRPDADEAMLQHLAIELANAALPRFPFVELEEPEPVVLTIEHEPVDRSGHSFVENLLAKETDGEWTRGEGLVATLRFFAGEIEATEVLRGSNLLDHSGTGIVRLAQEYLEAGGDPASAAEIERLLGKLLVRDPRGTTASAQSSASRARSLSIALTDTICYSPYPDHGDPCFESLEAGEDRASAAETEPPSGLLLMHDPRQTTANARSSPSRPGSLSIALADDICYSAFPDHGDPCFKWIEAGPDPLSAKYILWYPDLDEWEGWVRGPKDTGDFSGSPIHSAIIDSVTSLEAMSGEMPPVAVWLTPYKGESWVDWAPHGCSIYLASGAQELQGGYLQQAVASTVARCYIQENIGGRGDYEGNRWWTDGLAWYLSDVIYPSMSFELDVLRVPSVLAGEERASSLHGRALGNMPFFEYLDAALGLEGTLGAALTIASSGLENVSGIDELLHEYAKALTDGVIVDQGGAHPYGPPVLPAPLSPGLTIPVQVMPFGVERVRASVGPGEYACLEYPEVINLDIVVSWREGPPGQSGLWSENLPKSIQGQGVFLLTTTQPGGLFEIKVKKVVEDPEDCEKKKEEPASPPGKFEWCDLCPLFTQFFTRP